MKVDKKIIAREFLFFVGLLILILIAFSYIQWHNYQIDLEAVEMGKVVRKYEELGLMGFDENYKSWDDVKQLKEKKYSFKESISIYKKVVLWFLIFVYPIRFLVLGTLWSISTLRQKEKK